MNLTLSILHFNLSNEAYSTCRFLAAPSLWPVNLPSPSDVTPLLKRTGFNGQPYEALIIRPAISTGVLVP